MKYFYKYGIGIILYIIMISIIYGVYGGVYRPVIIALYTVIILQSNFIKQNENKKRYISKLVLVNILFILLFYIALPYYTYNEAKNLIINEYPDNTIVDEPVKRIRVSSDKGITPLEFDNYYYFITTRNKERETFIVNPMNGSIVKVKDKK
ncbi:hypothetical protein R9X47_11340 [Wukongibacter baidiensis]|uniref:hypothetical protein n=1 Tax=Wukongibacter baidiensis TaxID=1723361 RepID=UPI003D7FA494